MSDRELSIIGSMTFWLKITAGLVSCVGMLICFIYFSTMERIESAIAANNNRITEVDKRATVLDRELFGIKKDVNSLLEKSRWTK